MLVVELITAVNTQMILVINTAVWLSFHETRSS